MLQRPLPCRGWTQVVHMDLWSPPVSSENLIMMMRQLLPPGQREAQSSPEQGLCLHAGAWDCQTVTAAVL